MDFGFGEDQELLRESVRAFLDGECPIGTVRDVMETDEAFDQGLWSRIAELGWTGLTIPEEYGGVGLGWIDLLVVLEETGRSLFPAPLVSTTLAASALLLAGSDEQKRAFLPGIADGSTIATVALLEAGDLRTPAGVELQAKREGSYRVLDGSKHYVPDAGIADVFVVAVRTGDTDDEVALAIVSAGAEGVTQETFQGIDATKRLGTLTLDGVRIPPDAVMGDWSTISSLHDRGAVAVTAEMIGAAEAAVALTTQYAKDRVQFGSPIGRYQGVKHPLAEMYVDVESFKSLTYYAAWAIEESPVDLPRSASLAKAYASDAFARIGIDAVQLHGAVGYTAECDAQLYLKRSKWARPVFGDSDWHFERAAALGGL